MAHGDYNCCMICDRKMEYNAYEAETKKRPCIGCISTMRDVGTILLTPDEFVAHMKSLSPTDGAAFLVRIGFSKCSYQNAVDQAAYDRCNSVSANA